MVRQLKEEAPERIEVRRCGNRQVQKIPRASISYKASRVQMHVHVHVRRAMLIFTQVTPSQGYYLLLQYYPEPTELCTKVTRLTRLTSTLDSFDVVR